MMKRFTLTLMGLLLMVGGVSSQTVNLPIKGGYDWSATDGSNTWNQSDNVNYTSGTVTLAEDYWGSYGNFNRITRGTVGGTHWATKWSTGEKHTFTVTLANDTKAGQDLTIIAVDATENANIQGNFTHVAYAYINTSDSKTLTLDVTEDYAAVYICTKSDGGKKPHEFKITSITRTVTGAAPSVNAPTISPASGTYDGDLSVTISKAEGNDKVVYSVSGATTDNETDAEFTTASKTLTLTGTGTITVTAKGIKGTDESDVVTNTYTYGIPNGKTTGVSATYHTLEAISSLKTTGNNPEPKAVAYFDFEDGIAIRGWGYNNEVPAPEITIEKTTGVAIKGNKCIKVKNKSYQGDSWKAQFGFDFDDLERGCKYVLHLWGKASSSVSLPLATQDKPNNYAHRYDGTCSLTTEWTEKVFEFTTPTDNNVNQLMLSVGSINIDVEMYFDDFALYKVTEGSDAVAFTTDNQSVVIPSSAFSSASAGDYVALNVTGTPGTIAYKEHADNDEYKTPYLTDYTALTQTDGNWLIPVTAGMKTNGLTIKGHDMTLNSADIYKKVALSEATNNTISSKEDHVVVELTRSFVANTWNTVCLPFTLTSDQATQLFGEGYQLAQFTSVSGTTMRFTTADTFVAGVPYLVKPTIDVSYASPVVLVDVDITAKTPQKVTHKGYNEEYYSFVGNFTQKKFTGDNECNTSRFVATGNELKKPENNTTLKSLRCYFTVSATAPARSLSFDVDEEGGTTSINTVQGSGVMVNGYYNLNGQRVAKPTKGLFIVNGKKVLVNDKR